MALPKCSLCLLDDANATGSHFVSNCVVEAVYGKRGKEAAYTIDLQNLTYKSYYGPSNLENSDTTIRKNFVVQDHVFCQKCEDMFSILENECCTPLRKSIVDLNNGLSKIYRTTLYNKYIIPNKLKKSILGYFIYSLVWRQILEHKIKDKVNVVDNSIYENLRKELLQLKGFSYKEIRQFPQSKLFDFIILTSYSNYDTTMNPVMANPEYTNPFVFLIGVVKVLLFVSNEVSPDFKQKTMIDKKYVDKDLLYKENPSQLRIGIINEGQWVKALKTFYRVLVDKRIREFNRYFLIKKN